MADILRTVNTHKTIPPQAHNSTRSGKYVTNLSEINPVLTFLDEEWRPPLLFQLVLYLIVLLCKLLLLLPLFLGLLFCFLA